MSDKTFGILAVTVVAVLFAIVVVQAMRNGDEKPCVPPVVKCECICPVTP